MTDRLSHKSSEYKILDSFYAVPQENPPSRAKLLVELVFNRDRSFAVRIYTQPDMNKPTSIAPFSERERAEENFNGLIAHLDSKQYDIVEPQDYNSYVKNKESSKASCTCPVCKTAMSRKGMRLVCDGDYCVYVREDKA